MLLVKNVSKNFGGLKAVDKVSLKVEKNSITGLIGPNGSGKTTLFNLISGFCKNDSGEIYFKGERIDGLTPNKIVNRGLYRTFQIPQSLQKMTVLENILFSFPGQLGESIAKTLFAKTQVIKQEESNLKEALLILEAVKLKGVANEYSSVLGGGEKKSLALARILAAKGDFILLDEIAAGLNSVDIRRLIKLIKMLRDKEGKTLFLVEHNMKVIWEICDKIYVLETGKKIAEGIPEEIQKDKKVIKAYLGSTLERKGGGKDCEIITS